MIEVEVYSVNKLTFWAMDKNVVGKKNSHPGELLKEIPPYTSIETFDTKEANFENDIASEKWI